MEFSDVVRRRRMVRQYADQPVAPAIIDRMLDNALRAPSAGNSCGWAFLRLEHADDVELFWETTAPPRPAEQTRGGESRWLRGMRTAPVVIIPFSDKEAYLDRYAEPDKGWSDRDESRWPIPYWHIDTGMAALLILQTAVDEGLGACFFGIPAERVSAFKDVFEVPARFTPIGAITVGHPAPDARASGSVVRRPRPRDADAFRIASPTEKRLHTPQWGMSGVRESDHAQS